MKNTGADFKTTNILINLLETLRFIDSQKHKLTPEVILLETVKDKTSTLLFSQLPFKVPTK